MGAPKPYNGHHCWNCWNVALWISNDEGLYNLAMEYVHKVKRGRIDKYGKERPYTFTRAAYALQGMLPDSTPDGARYTIKALTSALVGLAKEHNHV